MKIKHILMLFICAQSLSANEDAYIGCWNTVNKDADQKFSLCANRGLATATIYSSKQGKVPTVCSQFGYSESSKDNKVINFNLHAGTCKNKALLDKANVTCEVIYKSNLICKHSAGYDITLAPIVNK